MWFLEGQGSLRKPGCTGRITARCGREKDKLSSRCYVGWTRSVTPQRMHHLNALLVLHCHKKNVSLKFIMTRILAGASYEHQRDDSFGSFLSNQRAVLLRYTLHSLLFIPSCKVCRLFLSSSGKYVLSLLPLRVGNDIGQHTVKRITQAQSLLLRNLSNAGH